ncbi:MAG: DUF86 domain-containing protein [Chloroflexi bacterium]|nr:DUF86 domain-containing protein [Chloroflexota bacterium]
MRPDDAIRLRHILDAAREAIRFAQGRSRDDLDHDLQLVWALVKAVEIIGEAAYQMHPDSRAEVPAVPWDDIIGMRHRLVHAYFDINLNILWKTTQDDLPMLIATLQPHVPPGEA